MLEGGGGGGRVCPHFTTADPQCTALPVSRSPHQKGTGAEAMKYRCQSVSPREKRILRQVCAGANALFAGFPFKSMLHASRAVVNNDTGSCIIDDTFVRSCVTRLITPSGSEAACCRSGGMARFSGQPPPVRSRYGSCRLSAARCSHDNSLRLAISRCQPTVT